MTTLAISAPQPNVGTITRAGLTRISSLLAGSMIWVKSTATKLVATPLAPQDATCWHGSRNTGASRIDVTPAHRARRVHSSSRWTDARPYLPRVTADVAVPRRSGQCPKGFRAAFPWPHRGLDVPGPWSRAHRDDA